MKISKLELFRVPPRWLFLAIHTNSGLVGWGEPIVEGRAESVAAAVGEMLPYLIGEDPRNINGIWQTLYRSGFYRGGPVLMSALSGIDQALWDIKGKEANKPVYELLGGLCRDRMKVYTWVGGDNPNDEIEQIAANAKKGRRTFKLNGCGELNRIASHEEIDAVVARIGAIRDSFGNTIDFALDFHGRVSTAMAKVLLKELEFARPLFVEEAVLPEFGFQFAELAQHTSIPLATGERLYSRYDFRSILEEGGISIVQPDPSHAGGITECLKIAALADTYDVSFAPHCPLGPMALASCLALDFVSQNAVLQEFPIDIHYNNSHSLLDYVSNKDDFLDQDGYVSPLSKPGLGVEIDVEAVKSASQKTMNWRPPEWRHADNSVAEW